MSRSQRLLCAAPSGIRTFNAYALYQFDNDSGGTFVDSSGNNRTLTLVGTGMNSTTPAMWGAGGLVASNTAAAFIRSPFESWAAARGDLTVEMWMRVPAADAAKDFTLFHLGNQSAGTSGVHVYWDGVGGLLHFNDGASVAATTALSNVPVDQWVHLAFVQWGGWKAIFINGVRVTIVEQGPRPAAQGLLATFRVKAGSTTSSSDAGLYNHTAALTTAWDSLRVVYNAALYTTNFTPPTGPLQASGTFRAVRPPCPSAGQLVESYYADCDFYGVYTDGNCGTVTMLECQNCC